MTSRRAAFAAIALGLAGACSSGGGYVHNDPYYDYDFRYGIYSVHHHHDVDVSLPDRPRPPPGVRPGRPTTLPARVPRGGGPRR
ncbi:hypothetical protein [Rubrimonas cliftonensis]|uniref:Lipoprotein n=1 Tax=Rubrimonas cliftonensis TaxID=89524 RepID=A0A1H4BYN5_9RHOB|nr:hypothetical protein [Rubrimonas cliftonensis]SEA53193.1 hypothetical protein SAMN05444370_106110 [Rubrimonas cliftonensis]